jgi:cobalt-zinc-cadmium efflux system outer membrane protein
MRFLAVLSAGLLAGCASVKPQPSFEDVQRKVAERAGQAPSWIRTAEEAEAVGQQVKELLREELDAGRAVRVALINNRELQARLAEIGVSQADLAQASRVSNPEVQAFLRFPDREPRGTNLELSLVQDFLDVLLQPLRKKIAAAQLEQTKLRVGHELLRLAADTKAAYYTLVASQQLVGRLELVADINRTAAELALRQLQAGNVPELELLNHQAVRDQSRADVALARLQVRRDRERLNRLMGLWGSDTGWTAPAQLPALPEREAALEHLESLAVAQRLDLEAARFAVDAVGRALALKQKTRYFPIGIQVGVEHERDTDGQRVTGPSLSLQLPIFDTGRASVARLTAEYERAQRQLEALAIDARSEVREARDALLAARDLQQFYASVLLPARVRILDQESRHYNMMLKGVYDILLAKQSELATERSYLDAWRDYWLARTELERALGGALPAAEAASAQPPEQGENR